MVELKNLLFLIIFVFAVSCMDEQGPRNLASTDSQDQNSGTTLPPTTGPQFSSTKWFTSGQSTTELLLNSNNQNTIYLRGAEVHSFLSLPINFSKQYCLVVNFIQGVQAPKEYRVKAIPSSTIQYATNSTEYYFRINFNSPDGNAICNQDIIDISNQLIPLGTPVNDVNAICSTCTYTFESQSIKLYSYEGSVIREISNSYAPLNSLHLRINPNNDSNTQVGSCSNSSCQALGFDCCLDGQCVNNKGVKPSASSSPSFATIDNLKFSNPNWYLNYPEYYYICPIIPPTTGGQTPPSNTTTPEEEAQAHLQAMLSDYNCIEELKANSTSDPFHLDYYNPSATYSACSTNSSNNLFYEKVLTRLYQNCGCVKTTLQDMINSCPKYTYTKVFNGSTLARIDCVTPQPEADPTPFQNLNVNVSSKTAPHRFFKTNGVASDTPTGTQEGTPFSYLDSSLLFPDNGVFNMNSILGQLGVSLSNARPATVINIDPDKTYFIGTTEGLYTPCPTCGKDSWFPSFTAFPLSFYGTGMQAVGYTTKRAEYGSNLRLGNYEDTIFGRACFVPPTMLPFSHSEISGAESQNQRLNRLKTQAFMYVNGYQRDWYGFNKGALIGSFDGVSWFAIGKGRIAKSTTNKLFLAINAPFADLAENNNHVVTVQEYDFMTTAAKYDYDFDLQATDSRQNEAGSCQKWHECSVDTDCVTKLGWEYSCVDVSQYKSKWPKFDVIGAKEISNDSRSGTIYDFLNQEELSGSSTKRCVYRGAGAPCQKNYDTISNSNLKKALTCAPNFYCASLDTENTFNTEVARFGAPLENLIEPKNHLYGQDALVLGRPKHYIVGSSLTNLNAHNDIKQTLKSNLSLMNPSAATSNFGICRPGRKLPDGTLNSESKVTQHQSKDPSNRTDYISQIAGCNSNLYDQNKRFSSCPIVGTDGNLLNTYVAASNKVQARMQNSCGLESLESTAVTSSPIDTLWEKSAFKMIEGRSLASSDLVVEQTMARDACYRRAGSVCHTDYDCSPNKLMASVIDLINPALFGNAAERKYYEEYLVCGQAKDEPAVGSGTYNDYDMTKNRCCREIGKTLTLYTEDTPGVPETSGLKSDHFGSFYPNDVNRYSRYANVDDARFTAPTARTSSPATGILKADQWKTISDSAGKTCCGGGFIRKFSDGTNNWAKTDRLNLDVENFRCLNYKTPLMDPDFNPSQVGATQAQLDNDLLDICVDPGKTVAGCAQYPINTTASPISGGVAPVLDSTNTTITFNTLPNYLWNNNFFSFGPLVSMDSNPKTYLDWTEDISPNTRTVIYAYIPSWFSKVSAISGIKLVAADGSNIGCTPGTVASSNPYNAYTTGPGLDDGAHFGCQYQLDYSARTISITFEKSALKAYMVTNSPAYKKNWGVQFTYTAQGSEAAAGIRSSKPGDYIYYLNKLAKLEYIGVPQMTYEPLFCNTNHEKIVPGIFKSNITDAVSFNGLTTITEGPGSYWGGASAGGTKKLATSEQLDHSPIFSSQEFMCCSKLGQEVSDPGKCCSGFGIQNEQNDSNTPTYFCKLPPTTDLMVYFNRFISNEGVTPADGITPLVESDFDSKTGEPKKDSSIMQKIVSLGNKYCSSGRTRRGGAFGEFPAEPFGSQGQQNGGATITSIVDSATDIGEEAQVETGYSAFYQGFRWNNHIYCDYE